MGLDDIIAENSMLFTYVDNIVLFTKIVRYYRAIFENVSGTQTGPEIKPKFDFFFYHFASEVWGLESVRIKTGIYKISVRH
jgi:hypothetical protein